MIPSTFPLNSKWVSIVMLGRIAVSKEAGDSVPQCCGLKWYLPSRVPPVLLSSIIEIKSSSNYHSSIHSFIHSLIHPFIYSFIHSLIHSFTNSSIHSSIHLLIQPFTHSSVHLLVNSFTHSFIHSFIRFDLFDFLEGCPSAQVQAFKELSHKMKEIYNKIHEET